MPEPVFDFVPIIQDTGTAHLRMIVVKGFSTRIGSETSIDGRLYGRLTPVGAGFLFEVFNDFSRTSDSRVMFGSVDAADKFFQLDEDNSSGLIGRAAIKGSGSTISESIIVVTFATDADIMSDPSGVAKFPGYDSRHGLATIHARSMRRLLASFLPQAVPHLYVGKSLSAFAPLQSATELPDLSLIRNPDALEQAQADLTKEISANEKEYLEEWAKIAESARTRLVAELQAISVANPAPPTDPATLPPNSGVLVQFGSFGRG